MGSVFQARRRAFVIYETNFALEILRSGEDDKTGRRFAVVRFEGCGVVDGDGPNDEALHNHPCFAAGLKWCALQEVVGSPVVVERVRMGDKDKRARLDPVARPRHFVLAFKENAVDCIAESYRLVGVYESQMEAEDAVFRSLSELFRKQ
jgi:hypothetical protein